MTGVRFMMHASWWQIPMLTGEQHCGGREVPLTGAAAFIDTATGVVLRELRGILEDWGLPETRSAQSASLHITHVRPTFGT